VIRTLIVYTIDTTPHLPAGQLFPSTDSHHILSKTMSDIAALEERLPPETKEQNSKPEISLKERFFRYFQHEITG
jgi:hypothetical protein